MTAVIDGQLSIFDWMEDFAPAQDAEQAAGIPEQIEEPEVGQWVYTRGAPISRVMRRSAAAPKKSVIFTNRRPSWQRLA